MVCCGWGLLLFLLDDSDGIGTTSQWVRFHNNSLCFYLFVCLSQLSQWCVCVRKETEEEEEEE